jgi:hypothetical protein
MKRLSLVLLVLLVALTLGHHTEATYRPSIVRSIQRGSISMAAAVASGTATITAVTSLNWSRLRHLGCYNNDTGASNTVSMTYLAFTNTTTITATRLAGTGTTMTCGFEVTEYYQDVLKQAIQRGTISIGAGASNTATITSVTTGKTELDFLFNSAPNDTNSHGWFVCDLTNATTVTCTRGTGGTSTTVSWQAVEWK